ncbi:hypothetical protein PHLCEN_2v5670 [Hermanssonia centrifuga]|uniref:Uncharacterized protein n=1 Tax=Hermanssonia centrifuga TaxID=98765 RepID=A0A2R6P1Q7_9APHY|nr:hypothetical protein PHLCEN_2v5670 [Hermanssonia centrifuga]
MCPTVSSLSFILNSAEDDSFAGPRITSNLISRFTLRLRKVSDRSCNIDFTSQWSAPKFISDDSESDEDDAWDDRLRNVLSDTP